MDGHSILLIHLIKLIDAHLRCFPVGDAGGVKHGKKTNKSGCWGVLGDFLQLKWLESFTVLNICLYFLVDLWKTHLNFMLARLPVIFTHLPVLSKVPSHCQPGPLHHLWSIKELPCIMTPRKASAPAFQCEAPTILDNSRLKRHDWPWSANGKPMLRVQQWDLLHCFPFHWCT